MMIAGVMTSAIWRCLMPQDIDAKLATLRQKLAARKGVPGFEENARAIEQCIAELERVAK